MSRRRENPDSLTDFEELFCVEYTKDLNATDAYIRAGFKGKRTSAAAEASKLLRKPNIVAKIRTLMAERVERVKVESDDVLKELTRLGYSDIRELFDDNGNIKPIKDWPDEIGRAVSSIEVFEEFEYEQRGFHCVSCSKTATKAVIGQIKKLKLWQKNHALELMGKHKKLFTDKLEVEGKLTLADLVAGSKKGEEK